MKQSTGTSRWFQLVSRAKKTSRRRPGPASGRWGSRLSFETLENREMMATMPILFNIATDVATRGVEVAAFAQLTAPYAPSTGPALASDTYVYFDNSVNDYAAASPGDDFSFDLTIAGGQASFDLPDAFVKGGQIVISVGDAPVITYTASGFASPTAGTSPTSYFGLFEYTIDGSGMNTDMSLVDQIGFPFTVSASPAAPNPANDGVGIPQKRGDVFNLYGEYIASLGASATEFKQSLTYGNGYRILAPSHLIDGTLGSERPVIDALVASDYSKGGKLVIQQPYYYWVTALGSQSGETAAGNSQQAVPFNNSVNGHNVAMRTVNLSWDAVLGASGYKVYRSTTNDQSTANQIGTVQGGSTTTFKDKGVVGTPATPPANSYAFNPLNSYFNADLDAFFDHYTAANSFSITATFNSMISTFTGETHTDYKIGGTGPEYTVLKLTSSDYASQDFLIFKPYFAENTTIVGAPAAPSWMPLATLSPGAMVFGNEGAFKSGGSQPGVDAVALSGIENSIVSAFNRGLATNFSIAPSNWGRPPLLTSATATAGGSLTANTNYYYVITAVNADGETTTSLERHVLTTSANKSSTLEWEVQAGELSYNIYRSTTPGTGYQLITNVTASMSSPQTYTEDGTMAPQSQAPPIFYAAGTTSNWYAAFTHINATNNPTSGVSINGLAYGFAYDDQGGQSTDFTVPTTSQIIVDLESWGKSNPIPNPGPNPHPTPPSVPTSLTILTQPVSQKHGASQTVTFRVFTAHGHPFYGGTTVTVQLIGKQKKSYTVDVDPTTGIGTLSIDATKKGRYYLKLTLEDGSAFYSHSFKIKKNIRDVFNSWRR
jgi:hypothetical protein